MKITNISGVLFVVFVVVLGITSCSNKGYKQISNTQDLNIDSLHIFGDNFTKVLYKMNINIYSNELTGITIIKKTKNAMRVVAMSEMGMKYFDIEFPFNKPEETIVHYIMGPLNKKMLVSMLKRDFLLLFNLPQFNNSKVLISEYDKTKIIVVYKKLNYYINNSGKVIDIKKQHILRPNSSIVTLPRNYKFNPDTIYFNHGKISLKFVEINN